MPGRTFFADDDPFFEAVDLWYGVTADKEVSIPFIADIIQMLIITSGTTQMQ